MRKEKISNVFMGFSLEKKISKFSVNPEKLKIRRVETLTITNFENFSWAA